MNTVIFPRVQGSEKRTIKDFIEVVESSFKKVNTEKKFEGELKHADLIRDFDKCAMNDENNEEGSELILMPIEFQMKKFFELPGVFETVRKSTIELQQQNTLSNFINGSLWQ